MWDRHTGVPVAPAIVWQCRRTADFCARTGGVSAGGGGDHAAYRAGDRRLFFRQQDSLDSGQRAGRARRRRADGELLFGNIDTWLIWKLTNGAVHVTDLTNASRTMLMNLATGEWDRRTAAHLRRAARHAAEDRAVERRGGHRGGGTSGRRDSDRGHRGRSAGGARGTGVLPPGLSKNTYGTGCFALMHTGGTLPVSQQPAAGHARGFGGRHGRSSPWKAACSSRARRCSGCATSWA